MNSYKYLKPKYRNKIRVFAGKNYYTFKRYINWYFGKEQYSKIIKEEHLPYCVFTHKTPIFRELRNVDMWMQENKAENLKIALKKMNGILIKPGETFSYWKIIGKPTMSKGYKEGMVLHYGKFISGVGGGLCQLSNLIYWIILHTPLTVTERHRHSFDVFPDSNRTQPFGSGATCVYNYRDLQITNNTENVYQLNLTIENKFLVGQVNSNNSKYFNYKIYGKKEKITHEYWGAYLRHNEIWRDIFMLNDEKIDSEYICENHALMMYEPLLEGVINEEE